jgi:GGDEF domain-containing protein
MEILENSDQTGFSGKELRSELLATHQRYREILDQVRVSSHEQVAGSIADLENQLASLAEELNKAKYERNEAKRQAEIDPLTGFGNRAALDDALPLAESDPSWMIAVFDANNFGKINKVYGHERGDEEIKAIAEAFRQAADEHNLKQRRFFRPSADEVDSNTGHDAFRRGGDEFVMILPKNEAENIVRSVEGIFGTRDYGDFKVSLTGTIGRTFPEAEAHLQEAKATRKAADNPATT